MQSEAPDPKPVKADPLIEITGIAKVIAADRMRETWPDRLTAAIVVLLDRIEGHLGLLVKQSDAIEAMFMEKKDED